MTQAAAPAKPLHIFRPGRWTTTHGEPIEFSATDLAATAAAYDPKVSKAPLVVGHPKTDDPAKGWAVSLTSNGRGLFAAADKVDPEFAAAVRSGAYGTVSAKFYRPTDAGNPVPGVWYLRHIGFLGAQPPAVKGLDDPEFAEDDGCVCFQEGVAFGEWDGMTNANLWRNLREWILGKFGQDDADKVLPGYDVRALELGAQEDINGHRAEADLAPAFAEGAASPSTTTPKESPVTDQEAAQLRDQNAALQRQLQEAQRREKDRATEAVKQGNAEFAESMAREARIPSSMRGQVAAIGAYLQATPNVEFGDGTDKKPMHEAFRDLVRALPPAVEFGEQAQRARAADDADDGTPAAEFAEGADPARVALDKRIRAHAKQNDMSYAAAAHAVMRSK
ncbi:peptidase [Paracidovorax anthurii]|uniref:Peptidase n=1 Tax=Paracidovorax anthurii TaxID=78229 RepID=A0A328ZK97_9BURK|nr:peptidase [Paracidovorax anthurii]RAR86064.1 hypothetical protein AX018_100225 [Paracidovorax anthurii]